MRRNHRRRKGRGALPLILLGLVPALLGLHPAQAPSSPGPDALLDRAEGLDDPGRRAELARRALTLLEKQGVRQGLQLARACHLAGDLERAVPLFQAVIDRVRRPTPGLLRAFHLFCLDLDRSGSSAQAIAAFRAMCRLQPEQVWPQVNLAVGLRHAGRYAEADRILQEASRRDPQGAYLVNDRGLVWKAAGQPERAETLFRRAISMGGQGAADAATNLGLMLLDRGEGAAAEKVLRPDPHHATGLMASLMWLRNTLCHGKRPL